MYNFSIHYITVENKDTYFDLILNKKKPSYMNKYT